MSFQPIPQNKIIDTPGYYYLPNDISSNSTYNLKITVSNVTLDLNRKSIISNPSSPSTAITFGIYCLDLDDVRIYNGKVTGAFFGIHGAYNNRMILENIDFTGCTYIGANFGGSDNKIIGCKFANIYGYNQEAYAVGINTNDAQNAEIRGNLFYDLYRQPNCPPESIGEGVGVLLSHGTSNCLIEGNIFVNNIITDHTYGIWAVGSGHTLKNNLIRNCSNPISTLPESNITEIGNKIYTE